MTIATRGTRVPMMWAIVVFAAIAPSVLMTAPAIAGQLAEQWGLGPTQIGNLFAVELAAMSLATLPAYLWQGRFNWRKVALMAGLLFIVANLGSVFANSYHALMALRFVSALAGGTLMVICMASAAMTPDRNRAYGLWVMGQLVVGAVGLWLLPPLFARFGLPALYVGLAALMLCSLPLVRGFPASSGERVAADRVELPLPKGRALAGIAAVLLFYVSISAVWTFIGGVALAAGIGAETSGQVLAVASLMGILGAGVASLIGNRGWRGLWLVLGYGVLAAAAAMLLGEPSLVRFAVAALLFKYVWTFVLPFILGTLADLDRGGKLMNTTNLVIGSGLALGPAIAGPLIERQGDFEAVLLGSAALGLASLVLLSFARIPVENPTHASFSTKGVQS